LNSQAPGNPKENTIRALILAPTRELAIQIHQDAKIIGKNCPFRLGLVYGGTGYRSQMRMLEEGVDLLIGTPGRLIDYYKQGLFSLHQTEVVVLDEADRMFDLGFIRDIRYLLRQMPIPTQRQSLLFSATLSHRVKELAYEHMNDPKHINVATEQITADKIQESIFYPANDEKDPLLLGLLTRLEAGRKMIFVNTRRAVERVASMLNANGFPTAELSGDVPQNRRERLLQKFKDGDFLVLVATDVAARGLHIANVSHVINYDLPQDREDYVHRIGRTARAGKSGEAISFACEQYAISLMDIEQYIGRPIPVAHVQDVELVQSVHGGRSDRRSHRRPSRVVSVAADFSASDFLAVWEVPVKPPTPHVRSHESTDTQAIPILETPVIG